MTPEQLEEFVLESLSEGSLLSEIAAQVDMKRTTLYMRMQARPELIDAYARAREQGLIARGEELTAKTRRKLPTLMNGAIDPAAVSQLKLEIETEKWIIAKLVPKIFGDKLAIGGADDLPPIKTMADEQLVARIKALQGKLNDSDPS